MVALKLSIMNRYPTKNQANPYHAFVMRLWAADGNGGRWRVRLENVLAPDEVHTFSDLESLFYYLESLPLNLGDGPEEQERRRSQPLKPDGYNRLNQS